MGEVNATPEPTGGNNGGRGRSAISWILPLLIWVVSIGCLFWIYRDFDWETELPRLQKIHWTWIMLGVGCDILVYFCQAWRWNLLLRPVANAKLGRSVRAIYIGLFANEILPLRSGEAIRCYLQSLWTDISFPVALSSAIIERLIDGVLLIVGFFLTTFIVELPDEIEFGAGVLAVLGAILRALLIYAVQPKDEVHHSLATQSLVSPLLHTTAVSEAIWQYPSLCLAAPAH